jgi:hypothetical protein
MKEWDKELFIRIPKDLFNDPIWNNREYTKKEAYLDLYFLAHDSPNNKGAIVEINGYMVKVEVGEVPKGLRFYTNRWNWSTKKVSNFFKRLEELGHIKIKGNTPITIVKILGWIPRRKHEATQKKHEGNRSDTPVIQLDNKDNNKINNNKDRDPHSSFDFNSLISEYKDVDVQQSYDKYLQYFGDNPSEKGFRGWLDKDRAKGFNKKKLVFRNCPTGGFIAYCSVCGNKQFPNNEWQIREGSQCQAHRGAEFVTE